MKLKNVKLRNTDHGECPFGGVILTSCKHSKQGGELNLEDSLIYENIDGIMLEGDWHNRMLDFILLLEKIQEHKIGFVLRTNISFDKFKLLLGIASFEKTNNIKMPLKDISENDLPMVTFIGAVLMDYYLSHTKYYVESKEKDGWNVNVIEKPKGDK